MPHNDWGRVICQLLASFAPYRSAKVTPSTGHGKRDVVAIKASGVNQNVDMVSVPARHLYTALGNLDYPLGSFTNLTFGLLNVV